MFSVRQKREISDAVQKILRDTNHPELPSSEIKFLLHVDGAESWSWADIKNNGQIENPSTNSWNEMMENPPFKDTATKQQVLAQIVKKYNGKQKGIL